MVKSETAFPVRFLALTEQLLAAARSSNWQQVNELSAERDALLQGQPTGPWSVEEKQQLSAAQVLNEQVMALTAAHMDELRDSLRPLKVRDRLLNRYG